MRPICSTMLVRWLSRSSSRRSISSIRSRQRAKASSVNSLIRFTSRSRTRGRAGNSRGRKAKRGGEARCKGFELPRQIRRGAVLLDERDDGAADNDAFTDSAHRGDLIRGADAKTDSERQRSMTPGSLDQLRDAGGQGGALAGDASAGYEVDETRGVARDQIETPFRAGGSSEENSIQLAAAQFGDRLGRLFNAEIREQ